MAKVQTAYYDDGRRRGRWAEGGADLEVIPEEGAGHEFVAGVYIPPDAERRTFNENDVLGEFDRSAGGKVSLIVNDRGDWVDKRK